MIIWRFPLLCFFSISFGTELVVTQKFLAVWFGGINWSCFISDFSIYLSCQSVLQLERLRPCYEATPSCELFYQNWFCNSMAFVTA